MDYIGSKAKLNQWIFEIITKVIQKQPTDCLFLDACSGSGAISRYAASLGFNVVANDIMMFPRIIANGSIGVSKEQQAQAKDLIEELNKNIVLVEDYFYHNFCDESKPPRMYFTASNAMLIDGIRYEIDSVVDAKIKDYLLYCGLEALSRVSNTTGVQAAFLKEFKARARDRFELRCENVVDGRISAYSMDILVLLHDAYYRQQYREDVLYIDPPYNQRQYGPNYHLYETFVRNDSPKARGMTGLRDWQSESSSDFCTKKKCLTFLVDVIMASTAQHIFVSYNSDGFFGKDELKQALPGMFVDCHEKDQRRYKSDISDSRQYNQEPLKEYLFEIHRHPGNPMAFDKERIEAMKASIQAKLTSEELQIINFNV